jgi:hypothetical protein
MRWLLIVAALVLAQVAGMAEAAPSCTREEFAVAVDKAGMVLRQLNAENMPRVNAKLRQLKEVRGWPDSGFEEKAYEALQDERMAALDAQANDLLAKLDSLGKVEMSAEPDCTKLEELTAVGLELQATVKAKAAYTLARLDQMLGGVPAPPPPAEEAKVEAKTEPKTAAKPAPVETQKQAPPPPPKAAARPQEIKPAWETKTKGEPTREAANAPPPPPPAAQPVPPSPGQPTGEEGYTIDEITAVSAGFFGKVSAGLGSVIEHVFKSSGRPAGYILGTEGGGAFLAGVRYGSGILYMRAAGNRTQKVYWHGPSIGTDFGAAGSKTMFLIYRLKGPEEIYATFSGIDGSAYFVGGVGVTLVTNGKQILAPIRSGVGLRVGANIGYIRFTPNATWNPF